MAKRFFYVCAGLFLLAASYHLGARSAGAQGGFFVSGSFDVDMDPCAIDGSSQAWMLGRANAAGVRVGPVPLPKAGAILEATSNVLGPNLYELYVLYADGDAYYWDRSQWQFAGNLWGGTTPTQRESFGAMKSRYRGARGAAQPAPQDR